jgi:hypothetical protein
MIQVKFRVRISDTEATAGSSYDLLQIKDSVTHRFVGLWYDLTGGFHLFDSSGSAVLNIAQDIVVNQLEGFTINVFPRPDGRQQVHLYHAGVYFGNFITAQPMTPDSVLAGAVALTHGAGGLVNRVISGGFTIGSSAGASDILNDNGYTSGTIVPPWSAQAGSVTLSGYPALGQGTLWFSNAGAVAYVIKTFGPGGIGPPPPAPGPGPGPSGLIFVGDSSFKQNGTPRWLVNGWELDRCIVPWRGSIDALNGFINGLTMWSAASTVDSNMFLESYPIDEHKQFPTVNLTFLGKRHGRLPPDRHEAASSIQQTSGIVFSDAYILSFGLPPHWTARVTYISPTSRFVTWSRTPPNFDSISAPAPPEITSDNIVSLVLGGVDYTLWPAAAANYGGIVDWVLRWFMQRDARYTSSQELVPGQYFRAEVTTQTLLLPIQEEIVG